MNKFILVIAAASSLCLAVPAKAAETSPPAAIAQTQLTLVGRAQVKLKQDGLYAGAISGFRNNATTRAIRRYQHQHDLQVTGTLTPQTVTALGV